MLSGNKGEWSEVYVLLKLLADGKLYAADENLKKIPELFYPIIMIIRNEVKKQRQYRTNGNILINDGSTGKLICKIPKKTFIKASKFLFASLKKASGISFRIPKIEKFLKKIECNTLKATGTEKSDINIMVHDLRTGFNPVLGFSIKSMLGSKSTLFNPGDTTNFIYSIEGKDSEKIDIRRVNAITEEPKIYNRLKALKRQGFVAAFKDIQSKNLKLNLQLIDSNLPEIMAHLLLLKYLENANSKLKSLTKLLDKNNPLNFDMTLKHPFYEYKIKNLLTDIALGMTPAKRWTGVYDATGGIIIVKEDGDLVCYHIYNRNEFQEYLLRNTTLEQASTSRYGFGELYRQEGGVFIKLNLQIRFCN